METAVIWLLVIGPMLIGLGAAIWWGSGSKVIGLWTGFVPGAFVLIIAAALQAQILLSKPDAAEAPKENPMRAYVFPEAAQVAHAAGNPISVSVQAKNSGQTPAYDLTWRCQFVIAMIEIEDNIPLDDVPMSKQTLPVGQVLSYGFTFPDTTPEVEALLSAGKAAIYLKGEIRYKDVAGIDRYTDFLFKSGGRYRIKSGIAPNTFGAIYVKSN
ncbi:hypothetical protein [Bradyrhizobium lablabi]|uniref:hypothetical protein n=1 Tax=Bradyrhizobium lablabi TaxID=722472 RepID=UPI0012AC50AF|nr:hypothetical protein [Bradyrhizobium lablabi]